jgi:hypothetical protein
LGFTRNKVLANALIVIGVVLLIIGLLLPNYKIPQRLAGEGPKAQYGAYTVSSYIVPPIDQGSPISLNFLSDKSGATALLLAPFNSAEQSIDMPVVLNVAFAPTQKGIVYYTSAPKTAPYMLMITSYNSSSFEFTLDSIWSPFYQYRSATTFGILTLLVGVLSLYYCEYAERREQMFKKALSGIHKPVKA